MANASQTNIASPDDTGDITLKIQQVVQQARRASRQ